MPVEKDIIDRISALIEQGKPISPVEKKGHALTGDEEHQIAGWLTSAYHVVELVVDGPLNPYKQHCSSVQVNYNTAWTKGSRENRAKSECVGEMVSLLENLLVDIEAGLISSIVNQVRAETFDNFLDHGEQYYKHKRKQEAGTIAGVVFEDTIHRIAKIHDASNELLEDVINNLVKVEVLTQVKVKRAKVASHVRNKATHAEWDEFELDDVKVTIDFTRELIAAHLDG